jgi:sugar phosphate isomerase/epimerase
MLEIGVFSKTFARPTLDEVLDAVLANGLHTVQFNLSCAGAPAMPQEIDPALVTRIRQAFVARQMTMAALSGTFNMIHPNLAERRAGMNSLRQLMGVCGDLDAPIVTLSTGTRNPDNMWRAHPDNQSAEAWADLLVSMQEAAQMAEEADVILAFEPEVSNVVDSAMRARRLLDEIRSPALKVVIDGANLFHTGELPRMREILTEAFDLLGDDIVLAHAKDLSRDGEAGREAAGTGLLDYDLYMRLLHQCKHVGALILHSLSEEQVAGSVAFLRARLA